MFKSSFCCSAVLHCALHLSLQLLALERNISVTLPEEVLAEVAPPVSAVSNNGDHHLAVLFVISEHVFEPISHVEEFFAAADLALNQPGANPSFIRVLESTHESGCS